MKARHLYARAPSLAKPSSSSSCACMSTTSFTRTGAGSLLARRSTAPQSAPVRATAHGLWHRSLSPPRATCQLKIVSGACQLSQRPRRQAQAVTSQSVRAPPHPPRCRCGVHALGRSTYLEGGRVLFVAQQGIAGAYGQLIRGTTAADPVPCVAVSATILRHPPNSCNRVGHRSHVHRACDSDLHSRQWPRRKYLHPWYLGRSHHCRSFGLLGWDLLAIR
jgi:hypothetical protein